MSVQITASFVDQYRATLWHLVQQRGSLLRNTVTVEPQTGEAGYFDQIGVSEAQERTTRHGDSPMMNTPHDRRKIFMRDFEWGDMVDNQDKIRTLNDPTNAYLQSGQWALGRKMDDLIIAAATAAALTGRSGGTTVNFPTATQQIPSGSVGLTVDKLLRAKEILDANQCPPASQVQRTLVHSAKQLTNLLGTTQVTSADYNTVKALVQGEIDTFLGFKFIGSERLGLSSTSRRVLAYCKTGIGLAVGMDFKGRIAERPDKSFGMYVYGCFSADAVRLEEKQVVDILCAE